MKQFVSAMLGTIAGMAIFSLAACVLLLGGLGLILALGEKPTPTVPDGSYLVFDLSTTISDAPAEAEFSLLSLGGLPQTTQLRTVTRALRNAATDDRILGVLIEGSLESELYGSGYAALREVREALQAVRDAGKPVRAYLTDATLKDYYLASAADDVILDPFGLLEFPGLASEAVFFRDALEKFGIGIQVTRVGRYKSAVEPFILQEMSPESREQMQSLLDDIWGDVLADVSASRGLTQQAVQGVVDREGVLRAEEAVAAGLVDRSLYRDQVLEELQAETGPGEGDGLTFSEVSLANYARTLPGASARSRTARASGGDVALFYVEGDIVDGAGSAGQVGGDRYAGILRQLRLDDDVKAIVLRINSPGGSASAAEAIQREVTLAAAAKPVIVSMGAYAASGGYWIATPAGHIFAEPSTITGSIGVFGLQFDIQQLAGKLGVNFESVTTGRFADAMGITRPKTDEEMAVVQDLVDWIYDEFIARVVDGRALPRATVEEIAQGRVWSGLEARDLGLVDELGGLDAALAFAAERAGLGDDYTVAEYPRPNEFTQLLQQLVQELNSGAGSTSEPIRRLEAEWDWLHTFNDPAGVYARLPFNLRIR